MNRFLPALCLLSLTVALSAPAAITQLNSNRFTLPDGFEITMVAGPDLVPRPVSASFDKKGYLYVTDSSGSNAKPAEQLANPDHRVLRLEDSNNDGTFDKSVVFADKMMFPQGCLWYDGAVYVAAPPHIWKLTDTNNDGVADERKIWYDGKTLTGCANDLHGPYLGPDGYIYWTKGAFDEQTHVLGNGRTVSDRAAHIFRARPDGSDVDIVMTGGMDNPVEVAFTPDGEAIFTSTFIDFSQPGFRDGIGHAVYGGVFGKVQSAIEDPRVKRTSPDVMQPFYQAGPSAISGLCLYNGRAFAFESHPVFFATSFNLRKVTQHVLNYSGATYASSNSDFVVSDNPDFHPTDVLPTADGDLLIVDTGGWYKLCCPSSQLAKPDVLGAIYRVKKPGFLHVNGNVSGGGMMRNLKMRSIKRDATDVSKLRQNIAPLPFGDDALDAHRARVSAEALGRIGDRESIPALLALAANAGPDKVLVHSAIYALIEIAASAETRAGLKASDSRTQRAALIALDQMDGSDLKPADVTPFLISSDPELRKAAAWIAGRHPQWGDALAGAYRAWLATKNLNASDHAELEKQLVQFRGNAAIQGVIAGAAKDSSLPAATRLMLLRVMAQGSLQEAPSGWADVIIDSLVQDEPTACRAGIAAARTLGQAKSSAPDFSKELLRVGADAKQSDDLRLEALAALPSGLRSVNVGQMEFLRANLDAGKPVSQRALAVSVLAKAQLNEAQLLTLADALKSAGPLETSRLLPAFEQSTSEAVGLRVLAGLQESKGLSGVHPEAVKNLAAKYPKSVQEKSGAVLALLNVDEGKQKARIDEMLANLPKGEIRRGQVIFNSQKAACASCHKIGYVGGTVGPDLTTIGQARTERDLLESIVYPSASFVRSYEPMIVTTKSDDEHSGVLRRDAPDEIVLATGPNTEARVTRGDIREMRPGAVSVMPAGLEQQLSAQELADLVTFLKNTKWGAN